MSRKALFSVIIPTLNEELYVPNLLSDLRRQRGKKFEVIVVDGHSDDNTKKAVMKFKDAFPLRFVESSRRNLSYQRNLGAEKADGEYLIFIDADSRVTPTFIQKLSKALKERPSLVYLPKILPSNGTYTDETLFSISNYVVELSQILRKPIPSMSCMIFQSDFFRVLGGYTVPKNQKKHFPEDQDILIRSRKYGVIARYLSNLHVKFSLRRFQKEGRLSVIRTYMISSVETILSSELRQRSMDYEMGGHNYLRSERYSKSTIKRLKRSLQDLQKLVLE